MFNFGDPSLEKPCSTIYISHLTNVMNGTGLGSNADFPSSLARLSQLQPPKTRVVGKWGFRSGVVCVCGWRVESWRWNLLESRKKMEASRASSGEIKDGFVKCPRPLQVSLWNCCIFYHVKIASSDSQLLQRFVSFHFCIVGRGDVENSQQTLPLRPIRLA
jgi:hypothetical protein